ILPVLNTLNISHNYLKSIESIAELRKCDFVSVLDISHNRIEDIAIVKVLGDMKGLRVLTMVGNPVVNDIPSYRNAVATKKSAKNICVGRRKNNARCGEASMQHFVYAIEEPENLNW
uniref:Dynein axonemal assembly factor 1 homolog n=1 Tax=Anopheles maculatus TaxID=74869 RepID=A0A182S8P9_9DIPT